MRESSSSLVIARARISCSVRSAKRLAMDLSFLSIGGPQGYARFDRQPNLGVKEVQAGSPRHNETILSTHSGGRWYALGPVDLAVSLACGTKQITFGGK